MIEHLAGRLTLDQAISDTKQATRRYAKRQLTWFRNDKDALRVEVADWQKIIEMITFQQD
jgi:tRNA dimethylallyltransferase